MKRDIKWLLGPQVDDESVEVLDSDYELDYDEMPLESLPREFPGAWSQRQQN